MSVAILKQYLTLIDLFTFDINQFKGITALGVIYIVCLIGFFELQFMCSVVHVSTVEV